MNKTKILQISMLLLMIFTTSCFATTEELKIHEESKTIIAEDVEQYKNNIPNEITIDNVKYQLQDIEQHENKDIIKLEKEETEQQIVNTNNKYDALTLFDSKKEVSQDGMIGILELQNDSLDLKVNDSYTQQYKVSLIKRYENVSSNELNDVPKTITQNNITYYLTNPIWSVSKVKKIEGQDVPISYNGRMYYTGIQEKTIIKNYIAEVKYKGTLEKEEIKSVSFNLRYKEIPQEEKADYIPVVATAGTGIVVISGIILWKRKNNKIS